jgi:hypothetical protein
MNWKSTNEQETPKQGRWILARTESALGHWYKTWVFGSIKDVDWLFASYWCYIEDPFDGNFWRPEDGE